MDLGSPSAQPKIADYGKYTVGFQRFKNCLHWFTNKETKDRYVAEAVIKRFSDGMNQQLDNNELDLAGCVNRLNDREIIQLKNIILRKSSDIPFQNVMLSFKKAISVDQESDFNKANLTQKCQSVINKHFGRASPTVSAQDLKDKSVTPVKVEERSKDLGRVDSVAGGVLQQQKEKSKISFSENYSEWIINENYKLTNVQLARLASIIHGSGSIDDVAKQLGVSNLSEISELTVIDAKFLANVLKKGDHEKGKLFFSQLSLLNKLHLLECMKEPENRQSYAQLLIASAVSMKPDELSNLLKYIQSSDKEGSSKEASAAYKLIRKPLEDINKKVPAYDSNKALSQGNKIDVEDGLSARESEGVPLTHAVPEVAENSKVAYSSPYKDWKTKEHPQQSGDKAELSYAEVQKLAVSYSEDTSLTGKHSSVQQLEKRYETFKDKTLINQFHIIECMTDRSFRLSYTTQLMNNAKEVESQEERDVLTEYLRASIHDPELPQQMRDTYIGVFEFLEKLVPEI